MTTGEIIRTARREMGWSQKRLAKEVGISRNSLNRIENGETTDMFMSTAIGLSRALGISLYVLLCREC